MNPQELGDVKLWDIYRPLFKIGGFPKWGYPPNAWCIGENPIEMDDLDEKRRTPISGNLNILFFWVYPNPIGRDDNWAAHVVT